MIAYTPVSEQPSDQAIESSDWLGLHNPEKKKKKHNSQPSSHWFYLT